MSRSFGIPGESARKHEELLRKRREELERLEREERNWGAGAVGEESTADWIDRRCPSAVTLHDRRMPGGHANIDHIVLVPSGVWVVDSKRPKGRIRVADAKGGTQKLLIDGHNRTELVDKLNRQVNAVRAALIELDPRVPVHGAFCFHLQVEHRRELLNPFLEDNGLPLFRTLTINGYPLFYPRQMCRRLNSPGTLVVKRAEELGSLLAARFPAALESKAAATRAKAAAVSDTPARNEAPAPTESPSAGRLSKEAYKAMKEAEQAELWEQSRAGIEGALGRTIPPLLSDHLPRDDAVFCHHALWHARVYLACVHGKVGESFPWRQAGSVLAGLHGGRAGKPQWLALNAFLEHLEAHHYVRCASREGTISEISVIADLQHPPRND